MGDGNQCIWPIFGNLSNYFMLLTKYEEKTKKKKADGQYINIGWYNIYFLRAVAFHKKSNVMDIIENDTQTL